MIEESDEKIKTGIEELGPLFAHEAKGFSATELDASFVRIQTTSKLLQPSRVLRGPLRELARIPNCLAQSCRRRNHTRHLRSVICRVKSERASRFALRH